MSTALLSRWFLICPILCCSLLTGCGSSNSWQVYKYDDWSFEVEFPGEPEGGLAESMDSDDVIFTTRSYGNRNTLDEIMYEVRVVRFEPRGLSDVERLEEMDQYMQMGEKIHHERFVIDGNHVAEVYQPECTSSALLYRLAA